MDQDRADPRSDADGGKGRSRDPEGRRLSLVELVLRRGYTRAEVPFQLSSGGMSRDYVDLRRAVASGDDLRLAAEAVLAHLEGAGVAFDAIGGMTMGADPVAHAVALLSGRSWFSVRKAEKSHGSRRRIEGADLGPGVSAVVFEDTVSTGGSLLDALGVVEATGAVVAGCCTILDRGDGARQRLAGRSVRYEALLTYADLGIEPVDPGPDERGGRVEAPV
jgi:orotate phosphoribosyltransferase